MRMGRQTVTVTVVEPVVRQPVWWVSTRVTVKHDTNQLSNRLYNRFYRVDAILAVETASTGHSIYSWTTIQSNLVISNTVLTSIEYRTYSVALTFPRRSFISNKVKIKGTRWLYCVECPQYSTRRRSASNIHRSSMLRKNRYVWKNLVISLLVYTGKKFSIITNIPLIIS